MSAMKLMNSLILNSIQLYLALENSQIKAEASRMRDIRVKGGHPYTFYHKGRW